ncbi:MAG: ATP-binding protein [Ignavibacteriales bacterium]|nr:ATP-binding protein [Ignavibacteriales bacterium]
MLLMVYDKDITKECTCSNQMIQKYMSRISGSLLDRIDINIEVLPVKYKELSSEAGGERSNEIRHRVQQACEIQIEFTLDFLIPEPIHRFLII